MFLGIPVSTWILQLLYVAIALAILSVFYSASKKNAWVIVLYVVVIIIVNIIWRMAIKK